MSRAHSRTRRAASAALIAPLAWALALAGCRSPSTPPREATEPPSAPQGGLLPHEQGLEVVRLTLGTTPELLHESIRSLRAPEGLDPEARRRLARNGLTLSVAREADVVAIVTVAGGTLSETKTFVGQSAQWQPTLRAPTGDHARLFVDGQFRASGPGWLELMLRAWVIDGPGTPSLDVQCQVIATAEQGGALPLALSPEIRSRTDGSPLPGTGGYFTLHPGEVAILSPAVAAGSRGHRGPDDDGPSVARPSDLLLTGSMGGQPVVTVLLLVPTGLRDSNARLEGRDSSVESPPAAAVEPALPTP